MPFQLPPLSYAYDAMEPFIDAQTMEIHHDKHHAAYVKNLNAALEGHEKLKNMTLNQLLTNLQALPESIRTTVRNNAGGHAITAAGDAAGIDEAGIAAAAEAVHRSAVRGRELGEFAAAQQIGMFVVRQIDAAEHGLIGVVGHAHRHVRGVRHRHVFDFAQIKQERLFVRPLER